MAEPQIMSPQEYGRSVLGYGEGQSIQGKELAKFRDQYSKYVQSASKSFTPSTGTATNAVTGAEVDYFMSSPNSAQAMREAQPKQSLELGQDGNMYVVDPIKGSATVVTNATGEPFGAQKKSNSMAELIEAMQNPPGGGGGRGPAPSGLLGFLGMGGAPTPAPTPMATPSPTPAAAPMTNAPTPAPTPMGETFSREQFRQMTGQDLPPGEYADAQGRPFLIR